MRKVLLHLSSPLLCQFLLHFFCHLSSYLLTQPLLHFFCLSFSSTSSDISTSSWLLISAFSSSRCSFVMTNDEPLPAAPVVPLASSVSSVVLPPSINISPRPALPSHNSSWISVLSEKEAPHRLPSARVHNGVIQSNFPVELLKDQAPLWSKFIAGYFIGDDSPHIGKVHATVNRLWTTYDKKTKIDAQFISPKIVLFKIEDDLMRRRVLQRHFWHVADIPMIVQQWSPSSAGKSHDLSSIPLWVDFLRVSESLYSKRGLLFLGNLVGKAQKLHPSTERCSRFDVARVLVEVNLNSDLPSLIKLDGESDISIPIVYPWLPPRCSKCSCWGHKLSDCVSKVGTSLADSTAEKNPCPEQGSTLDPAIPPVQSAPVKDPACPAEVSHSKQATSPVQSSPVHAFSPALLPAPVDSLVPPVLDTLHVQSTTSPVSSPLPPLQVIPAIQVRTFDDQLISVQDHQGSPPKSSANDEQNWTFVSKAKGSPIRTIMTRGKSVAICDLSSSRYQILEKEPLNLDDIEDGEIQGNQSKDSSSDEVDPEVMALNVSCHGEEGRTSHEIKTHVTRQKDKIRASRQNTKSRKPSSRKA